MAVGSLNNLALFPQVDMSDAHGEFSGLQMPAISGSLYTISEPSDDEPEDVLPVTEQTMSEQQPITSVQDAVQSARRKLTHELDCMDQTQWSSATLDGLLAHIAAERLARMPHNGSQWDKTLKDAESFAVHISQYNRFVEDFLPQSSMAAELIWSNARILLELGSHQAPALEKAFGGFYVLSLDLITFSRFKGILDLHAEAKRDLADAYATLLSLVVDITVSYQRHVIGSYLPLAGWERALTGVIDDPNAPLSIDSGDLFLSVALAFHARKQHLVQAIWDHQTQNMSVDHRVIQNWLAPRDYFVRNLRFESFALDQLHPDLSCDWFHKHLTGFLKSRQQSLEVIGRPGCGKTSLFFWTLDTLQRRVLGKVYTALAYSIDPATAVETSPARLVRCLLSQILERNVGDTNMIKPIAKAYERALTAKDPMETEFALWQAFESTVQAFARTSNLLIIVDGLDAIAGGEPTALEVMNRLYSSVANNPTVKVVILARPFSKSSSRPSEQLLITPEHTFDELSHFIERGLSQYSVFKEQAQDRRAAIVERIARGANGSFVWADLVLGILKQEDTPDGLLRAIEKAPKSVANAVQRILAGFDTTQTTIKSVFSWLLVALRPLRLDEIQLLAGTNTRKQVVSSTITDGPDDLILSSRDLLVLDRGLVSFRHNVVRELFLEMSNQGRWLLPLKDAHRDFTSRLLTLARLDPPPYDTPTLDLQAPLPGTDTLLISNGLFEYAARYWMVHFYRSSLYKEGEDITLPADFKKSFSNSVYLAVVEGKVWEISFLTPQPHEMHTTALQVRREALGDEALPVLQSLVNVATALQSNGDRSGASTYFYQASVLSQKLLGLSSALTSGCASSYINCAGSYARGASRNTVSRTGKMLKLLLEASKHQCGSKSDHVIKYQQALGDFYMDTEEEPLAAGVFDELHDLVVERFGSDSFEAKRVNAKLAAALQGDSMKGGDTMLYAKKLFELSQQTMDETDPRRVAATIRMAEAYQTRDDFMSAEELLVGLWKQITDVGGDDPGAESQNLKFGVAVAYIEFLRRCERETEAVSMLLGLWTEFEHTDAASEADIERLRHLQGMLQSAGQLTVSLSALAAIWKSYVRSGQQYSDGASSVASQITQNVQAIQDQADRLGTASTSTHAAFQDPGADSILQEVFNMGVLGSTSSHPSASTIKICDSTSASLVRQDRWVEAIEALQKSLQLVWPSLKTQGAAKELPAEYQNEALTLAERLASCLIHENRPEEALQIYLAMYEASKNLTDSGPMARTSKSLIQYYNDRGEVAKAIDINDDLLQRYRSELGPTNPVTVEALYALSSLCESVNQQESANKYYHQIIHSLNKDSTACHPDAINAALRLSEAYTKQGQWSEAVQVCRPLWQTVLGRGSEDVLTSGTLQSIHERYRAALNQSAEGDYPTLRNVAEQYYEACKRLFSVESAIAIKAAFELAEMNERSEPHQIEAIRIYEQIIMAVSSSPAADDPQMTDFVATAKDRLAALYRTMSLASSKSFSEVIQDAIALYAEKYDNAKVKFGCSDDGTLDSLGQLVHLYTQNDTGGSRAAALDLLQRAAAEIICNEPSPIRLWKSAAKLARIYSNQGYTEQGLGVVDALRRQIVLEDTTEDEHFAIVLDRTLDRNCYIFITTLEQGLQGSEKQNFSESMSDLLTETLLYERFSQSQVLGEKLLHGARLRALLLAKHRSSEVEVLENRAFEALFGTLGVPTMPTKQTMQTILTKLLYQLINDGNNSAGRAVCVAGNDLVKSLIEQEDFGEAYAAANSIFELGKSLQAYEDPLNIAFGLRMSLYMAGRGVIEAPANETLRAQMHDLSQTVLREVLGVCKRLNLSIGPMDLDELKDLVGLLSEQKSYAELEWLLAILWTSHATQKSWTPGDIIWFGRRYVEVRFARGFKDAAIQLCEDIIYNLTTLWGPLDPTTVEMSVVLSGLYAATERYQDAMTVHEEILRLLLARENDFDHAQAATLAKKHFEHLRQVSQRAGNWFGAFPRYAQLGEQLMHEFGEDSAWETVQPLEDTSFLSPKANVVPSLEASSRDERRVSPFRTRGGHRGRV
ncbi:MAG: hypothetical protein Q9191_005696 [Dirinaria sp. TL-2023a]